MEFEKRSPSWRYRGRTPAAARWIACCLALLCFTATALPQCLSGACRVLLEESLQVKPGTLKSSFLDHRTYSRACAWLNACSYCVFCFIGAWFRLSGLRWLLGGCKHRPVYRAQPRCMHSLYVLPAPWSSRVSLYHLVRAGGH